MTATEEQTLSGCGVLYTEAEIEAMGGGEAFLIKADPHRLTEAQTLARRQLMTDRRINGLTYSKIALEFGVSDETVSKNVKACLESRLGETVAVLVELENARFDQMLEKLKPGIDAGDPQAVNAALRVSDARRKMFGLDAAIKIDATFHEVTQADLELQELLREAQVANNGVYRETVSALTGGPTDDDPEGEDA